MGMITGFERIVEKVWIDEDKSNKCRKYKDESPSGYYTVVIIPKELENRHVVILPVSDLKLTDLKQWEKWMQEARIE